MEGLVLLALYRWFTFTVATLLVELHWFKHRSFYMHFYVSCGFRNVRISRNHVLNGYLHYYVYEYICTYVSWYIIVWVMLSGKGHTFHCVKHRVNIQEAPLFNPSLYIILAALLNQLIKWKVDKWNYMYTGWTLFYE